MQRTTFVARSSGLRLGQQENDGWSREGMVVLSDFHGFPFALSHHCSLATCLFVSPHKFYKCINNKYTNYWILITFRIQTPNSRMDLPMRWFYDENTAVEMKKRKKKKKKRK